MKICVLGAGVIGVSTAFALGRLGHEVCVIDKAPDVAMGASYANGAQLSYSYVDPLASPTTFRKLPSYLLGRDKTLQLKFTPKLDYVRWGLSFLRNCSSAKFKSNREERQALAELSSIALESFERDMSASFKPTGKGKLVLLQNAAEYEAMKSDKGYVTKEQCLQIEPSLANWSDPIFGGVYSDADAALNTLNYCKTLKDYAEKTYGVQYCFGETVTKIISENNQIKGIQTDQGLHAADKIIMCLGNEALDLLAPLGIRLPIYSVQGYSLTLNAIETSPRVSVTDLKNKIVFANLGDKFRIAGFADVNQRPETIESRIEMLLNVARQNWPNAADFTGPIKTWSGARPMMPSGVPAIGQSKVDGLYLNLGHGSLGYTFAAGSAMKIANSIGHAHKNTMQVRGNHNAA